jgi:hypothetical protein
MRKHEGLSRGDKVDVTIASKELASTLEPFAETIKQRVGARELAITAKPQRARDGAQKVTIKNKTVHICLALV